MKIKKIIAFAFFSTISCISFADSNNTQDLPLFQQLPQPQLGLPNNSGYKYVTSSKIGENDMTVNVFSLISKSDKFNNWDYVLDNYSDKNLAPTVSKMKYSKIQSKLKDQGFNQTSSSINFAETKSQVSFMYNELNESSNITATPKVINVGYNASVNNILTIKDNIIFDFTYNYSVSNNPDGIPQVKLGDNLIQTPSINNYSFQQDNIIMGNSQSFIYGQQYKNLDGKYTTIVVVISKE